MVTIAIIWMHAIFSSKILLTSMLVILWAAGTVYAFWWFEFKNLRPFDTNSSGEVIKTPVTELEQTLLKLTENEPGRIRVFHFWNPDCYCNRFNTQHLEQIQKQYKPQGIDFYLVVSERHKADTKQIRKIFGDISILETEGMSDLVPSTPSAAIIKLDHGLTYFGPYSEGAMCSAQSGSFVEKTLDATLTGTPNVQVNSLAFGCYCDLQPI